MNRVLLVWAALVIMGAATPAAAHPVPFSYLDARLEPSAVDVTLVAHVFDVAHDLGVDRPESMSPRTASGLRPRAGMRRSLFPIARRSGCTADSCCPGPPACSRSMRG